MHCLSTQCFDFLFDLSHDRAQGFKLFYGKRNPLLPRQCFSILFIKLFIGKSRHDRENPALAVCVGTTRISGLQSLTGSSGSYLSKVDKDLLLPFAHCNSSFLREFEESLPIIVALNRNCSVFFLFFGWVFLSFYSNVCPGKGMPNLENCSQAW